MADATVTAAMIRPLGNSHVRRYDVGSAVVPGNAVYITATGEIAPAKAGAPTTTQARGLVISNGNGGLSFSTGERVDVVTHGPVAGFTGLTPGGAVYLSAAEAGAVTQTAPASEFVIGYAESESVLYVVPQVTAATAP